MRQGKVWGWTQPLLKSPFIEIHEIWIMPNARCSRHLHRHRYNAFVVIDGTLSIHVKKSYGLVDVTTLYPSVGSCCTTVAPGEEHWFESDADCVHALEIYYPHAVSTEDIERFDVGTLLNGGVAL